MSKKGLLLYLVSEAILLCLIEVGKCVGWTAPVLQVMMYTAIVINTVIIAYRFYHLGSGRTKSADTIVAYALFATAAADFL